jgi:hypothetical protein
MYLSMYLERVRQSYCSIKVLLPDDSAKLFTTLGIYVSMYLSMYLSMYISIYVSTLYNNYSLFYVSMYLSTYVCIYLSIYL